MKLPSAIYYFLYKVFGIMNCKRCGQLLFNPTDQKMADHFELHDIRGEL